MWYSYQFKMLIGKIFKKPAVNMLNISPSAASISSNEAKGQIINQMYYDDMFTTTKLDFFVQFSN